MNSMPDKNLFNMELKLSQQLALTGDPLRSTPAILYGEKRNGQTTEDMAAGAVDMDATLNRAVRTKNEEGIL